MKHNSTTMLRTVCCVAAVCLAGLAGAGCGGGDKKAPAAGAAKKAASTTPSVAATKAATNGTPKRASVFTISKNLRDPFFPHSTTPPPGMQEVQAEAAPMDVAALLREGFQGVMGAGATRLAVINNTILEPGRRTEVPIIAGGTRKSVRVRCRQVLANGVVLEIEGQSQPITITKAPSRY